MEATVCTTEPNGGEGIAGGPGTPMTLPTDLLVVDLLDLGQQLVEPGLNLSELLLLLDHVVIVRSLADQHIEVDPLQKTPERARGDSGEGRAR